MSLDSDLFDRANHALSPICFDGRRPFFVKKAFQSYLVDSFDETYLDYTGASNLLGFSNPLVNISVDVVRNNGNTHAFPSIYEVEAAEKLKEAFIFTDKWRFFDNVSGAREESKVISAVLNKRLIFLREDEFRNFVGDLSKVSAVTVNTANLLDVAKRSFLQEVRAITKENGINLIFDESQTAFRLPGLSAAAFYSVNPDLIIIGSTVANGRKIAAVGGKAEAMNIFRYEHSSSDIETLAATTRTVDLLLSNNAPQYSVDRLWEEATNFMDKFNTIMGKHLILDGYPTLPYLDFAKKRTFEAFIEKAFQCKIIVGKQLYYNFDLVSKNHEFFEFLKEFRKYCDKELP